MLSPALETKLYDTYKQNRNTEELANLFGVSESVVLKIIHKVEQGKQLKDEAVNEVVEILRNGGGLKEVRRWYNENKQYSSLNVLEIHGVALSELQILDSESRESKTSRAVGGSRLRRNWKIYRDKAAYLIEHRVAPKDACSILKIGIADHCSFKQYYKRLASQVDPSLDFRSFRVYGASELEELKSRIYGGQEEKPIGVVPDKKSEKPTGVVPDKKSEKSSEVVSDRKPQAVKPSGVVPAMESVSKECLSFIEKIALEKANKVSTTEFTKPVDKSLVEKPSVIEKIALEKLSAEESGVVLGADSICDNITTKAIVSAYQGRIKLLDKLIRVREKELEMLRGIRNSYTELCEELKT